MVLARDGSRPPGRVLGLLAGTLLLLASPHAFAGLTVTLTDGTTDDVRQAQTYLGPQAPLGGYVQWVVRVASDDGAGQQVALKNTLADCMELLTYKDPQPDGNIHGTDIDPRLASYREIDLVPAQPDAVISVEGNTLLIQNISVPEGGELVVRYWARITGRTMVMPEPTTSPVRERALVDERRASLTGRSAQRTLGVSVDGTAVSLADSRDGLVVGTTSRSESLRARPTECSTCCNLVKVIDEEARLHLSQTPNTEVGFCAGTATGFEVLIPGAAIPAVQ